MAKYEQLFVKDLYAERIELLRPAWEDVRVSLATAKLGGNTDPTWTQISNSGLYAMGFVTNQADEVFFDVQTPHGAMIGAHFNSNFEGSFRNVLAPHIHWAPSTTNTGGVVWKLTAWVSNRDLAYNADQVYSSTITVVPNGAIKEQISVFDDIDASGFKDSTILSCRLQRLVADDGDTFTGTALGLSVDFHLPVYRFGSQAEYGDAS